LRCRARSAWARARAHGLAEAPRPLSAALLLAALLAAQCACIALFAVWRRAAGPNAGARAAPNHAVALGAEMIVCGGGLALALALHVGGASSGCWLILCVAAGLSLLSSATRSGSALSSPTR
jgi:hypothetical protein